MYRLCEWLRNLTSLTCTHICYQIQNTIKILFFLFLTMWKSYFYAFRKYMSSYPFLKFKLFMKWKRNLRIIVLLWKSFPKVQLFQPIVSHQTDNFCCLNHKQSNSWICKERGLVKIQKYLKLCKFTNYLKIISLICWNNKPFNFPKPQIKYILLLTSRLRPLVITL